MCIFLGSEKRKPWKDPGGYQHSRKVKKTSLQRKYVARADGGKPGVNSVPEVKGGFQWDGVWHGPGLPLLVGPLTSVTPLHVWAQPHCVRTGTGVLGRVAGNLRSRKAQVLTASIGLGTQLTRVCS